jgi:hypothetical protein
LNHPLKDVASKMPLLICLRSRKNAQTPQKSSGNIMQCFRSSRGGDKNIFLLMRKPKGQPLGTALYERKADG